MIVRTIVACLTTIPIALSTNIALGLGASEAEGTRMVTIGADTGDVRGVDSTAIQKALDMALEKAPKGGGQVLIKAGTYTLYNSLYIRGPITLRGKGPKTVLKKAPGYSTVLSEPLAAGAAEILVKDIGPIRPGWGFSINPGGPWMTSIRYAVGVKGNRITMDRPRNRELKYPQGALKAGARLQTSYPLIQVLGVQGVVIEDLVLDGNLEKNKSMQVEGCRNGGIYMCADAPGQEGGKGGHTIRRCVIRNFAGDGISWQGPSDVVVDTVEASRNAGNGLHPGTMALRTIIRNCKLLHNGNSGIYVCWDVRNGRFEDNVIESNNQAGISTGHGDSDCLFQGNQIRSNRWEGVMIRGDRPPPDRCVFRKNVIEDNGGAGFKIKGRVSGTVIEQNIIRDSRKDEARRTQKIAIKGTSPVTLRDNTIEGKLEVPVLKK